jgi:hypothetical protein
VLERTPRGGARLDLCASNIGALAALKLKVCADVQL